VLVEGEVGICYDTLPFFSASHTMGTATYANVATGKLDSNTILAGFAFMESIKNPEGVSLGIRPTMLVCGPQNRANAILALDNQLNDGGGSNSTYKIVPYMVLSEISDASWYLLDVSAPLKPFIAQIAEDGLYEASNDHRFIKDMSLFGTKSFLNAGYGLWQTAMKFKPAV